MKILLDPATDRAFGLLLLVLAPTGIVYQHQVNGFAVETREAEGFIIPLAGMDAADHLSDWFRREFRGWSRPSDWTAEQYQRLDALVQQLYSYGISGERRPLAIDMDRRSEVTEGWIPVVSALGPGFVVFENRD